MGPQELQQKFPCEASPGMAGAQILAELGARVVAESFSLRLKIT